MKFLFISINFYTVIIINLSAGQNPASIDVPWPKECTGMDICDIEPNNYSFLLNVLNDRIHHNMKDLFREGILMKTFDQDDNKCNSCVEQYEDVTPFMLRTNSTMYEGDKLLVVIQTGFIHQRIRFARCLKEGSPCFRELVPKGDMARTACETKYTPIYFYVYDQEENENKMVQYEIPISCTCQILKNYYDVQGK